MEKCEKGFCWPSETPIPPPPIKRGPKERPGKTPANIFVLGEKCKCSVDFLREFMERQIESNGHRDVSDDVP